jgi:hypothetical protein
LISAIIIVNIYKPKLKGGKMAKLTHSEMHIDHKKWESEIKKWIQDINHWQREYQNTLRQLRHIERSIENHGKALEDHRHMVQLYEEAIKIHDESIVEHEQSLTGEEYLPHDRLIKKHRDYAKKIANQGNAHERIRKNRHKLLTKLTKLKKVLEDAL